MARGSQWARMRASSGAASRALTSAAQASSRLAAIRAATAVTTVLEHDEHAVAAAHAGLAQVLLHDVHRAAKPVPGQTAPIMIDQRERIRGRRRVALDEVVDAARQGIEIEGRLRRRITRAPP